MWCVCVALLLPEKGLSVRFTVLYDDVGSRLGIGESKNAVRKYILYYKLIFLGGGARRI
jgi:hypothetical protein